MSIVIESLSSTYPEMHRNVSEIHQVLQHEIEIHKSLLAATNATELVDILRINPLIDENDVIDYPGFLVAYRELNSMKFKETVPGLFIFKLYDTYGLTIDAIERLATASGLQLDRKGFSICLSEARQKTKVKNASKGIDSNIPHLKINLAATDNSFKYIYKFNKETNLYSIPIRTAKVIAIIDDNMVVLNESPFYPESGGQQCDSGRMIKLTNGQELTGQQFQVNQVTESNGLVLHCGGESTRLQVGDKVRVYVDENRRTGNIQNHTAVHLCNAAVKHVAKCVTYQKSSSVTGSGFKLELGVLGKKLDLNRIRAIEDVVRRVIDGGVQIEIDHIDSQQFYGSDDICRIPGEIYPEKNVRILSIVSDELAFRSREPCCGTHAANTNELKDFCIINVKHTGRGGYILNGLAGAAAKEVTYRFTLLL